VTAYNDMFNVYAYNRYNQAGKSWVECARVAPLNGRLKQYKKNF